MERLQDTLENHRRRGGRGAMDRKPPEGTDATLKPKSQRVWFHRSTHPRAGTTTLPSTFRTHSSSLYNRNRLEVVKARKRMQNVMSSAVKFVTGGLAAVILVGMYAVGSVATSVATSTAASAHGWHCGWARGHRHPLACRGWGRRGRRGRGRRGRGRRGRRG